ncbi:hypothetical protein M9Y10_044839 [Tritrichomonas musculus]|uniref:Casein kinase II subunit beta n=1 Tax=Tritrichomonas musculus TaxID=1915356 RepID=A0ABR2JUP5_9EUKA
MEYDFSYDESKNQSINTNIPNNNSCSEAKNQLENINMPSNYSPHWNEPISINNFDFISSNVNVNVKFICVAGFPVDNNCYLIELTDSKSNKFNFILIKSDKSNTLELFANDIKQKIESSRILPSKNDKKIICIPIFDILIMKDNNHFFFHLGENGIKLRKKNIYQDITSYLDSDKNKEDENPDLIKFSSSFYFFLYKINENNKTIEYLYGECQKPVIDSTKESVIIQYRRSPRFEKMIFSCQEKRKSKIQFYSKFFVIIDRSFLFDTFNYWHDNNKGIEFDYNRLVQKDGMPFADAQQILMDPILDIQDFLDLYAESEQINDFARKSNYLYKSYVSNFKSFNLDQAKILFSIFCLYGLLHAKYILTPPGQSKMLELYSYNSFPKCPRSKCNGIRCLPYGITERPCSQYVKMYCPKCENVYNYTKNNLDGAFFGPTYVHLLIRKFPKIKEFDESPKDQNVSKEEEEEEEEKEEKEEEEKEKEKEEEEEEERFSMFGIPLINQEELKELNQC